MRRWMLLLSLLVAGMQVPAGATQPAAPQRVLFVGNSLTYVGNLPATFAALANANDQRVHSAMIVQGGATLEQRVADGSVVAAPVYAVRSGLHAELRDADAPAPLPAATAQGTRYTDALVMQLNALLDGERR